MFGSLLGGKFSNKCKHFVKCIKSRIGLIRRKKQAMLKYLKKDVAELMSNGHDINAFGRIEALIIEINHAYCYDMIEQYCECILQQLPSLQKQRECPEDAKEAMSTLVYAAARFSDLPELCDLRSAFTERYGSQMESSVSPEFVEKVQKKSFSMEKKLQLMRHIADDFSLRWDIKAFQQKLSNHSTVPAPASTPQDQTKKRNQNNDQGSNAGILRNASIEGKKEAGIDAGRNREFPPKERLEPPRRSPVHKEQVQPEPRDIHVVPSISNGRRHDPAEKNTKKVHAAVGVPESVQSYYNSTLKEGSFNEETAANRSMTREGPRLNGLEKAKALPTVKPTESQIGNRQRAYLDKLAADNESPIAREGPGLIGLEKQTVGSVISRDVRAVNMIPPYTKDGVAGYCELPTTNVELDPLARGSRCTTKTPNLSEARLINRMPPYTKPYFKTDDIKLTAVEINSSDRAGNDVNDGERPQPFSVRRKHPKPPMVVDNENVVDNTMLTNRTTSSRKKEDRWNNDINVEDTSMKRQPRQVDKDIIGEDTSMKRQPRQVDAVREHHVEDTSMKRPPRQVDVIQEHHVGRRDRRSHRSRRRDATYDDDCDEEQAMDRLLVHFSKKGLSNKPRKTRTCTRDPPPPELVEDSNRDGGRHQYHQNGDGRDYPALTESVRHRPDRVSSLPSEPTTLAPEVGTGRGLARATSLHPRLPDYDELAARFNALRKA